MSEDKNKKEYSTTAGLEPARAKPKRYPELNSSLSP